MRKLKKILAIALAGVMMAGVIGTPVISYADETVKRGWFMEGENNDWHFYDGEGNLVTGRIKMNREKWYGFDETGRMFCDELFADPKAQTGDGEEPNKNLYAFPDGHLATGWVRLDEEGHLYDGQENSEFIWHYFKANEKGYGEMLQGVETEINGGKPYGFDETGKMYSQTWAYLYQEGDKKVPVSMDKSDNNFGELVYYQFEGEKARDKWLPLGSYWYLFDERGVADHAVPIASSSDATEEEPVGDIPVEDFESPPARLVESIEVVGSTEVEAVPGKEITLKFKVELASDSNARKQELSQGEHDIWGSGSKTGSFRIKTDKSNSTCTAYYTPKQVRNEDISLFIDGIESETVHITPKLSSSAEQGEAANGILDSWEKDGYRASQVKLDIENIYSQAETEEQKKSLQRSLLNNNNYAAMASSYAMENSISESVSLTKEAQRQLGGLVSLTGGALNADPNTKVELKVNTVAAPELSQDYADKIAFDITMDIDGSPFSQLSLPVRITMPVPVGYDAGKLGLVHIHDGAETEVEFVMGIENDAKVLSFMTDSFSTYVFTQKAGDNNNNNSSSGSGSGSNSGSNSSQSAGTTTVDAKKGRVNSLTGIITGSGNGYSNWQQETAADGSITWKLRYADGSYAAGSIVTREDGTVYEQALWEMINGAWYAFGSDGCAEDGFVYDAALGGYFYIDINSGMKIGWAVIDGKWYYFNPESNGKKGMMVTDTQIDGWYVDKNGVWDGETKK